jgi:nucleoside-diphosphate-sugar epimerase
MLEQMLAESRDYFARKRALITGGCGFTASYLAPQLSQWGAEVRLFDCRDHHDGEFEFVLGDVRDYKALERATRGCDVVFHFAALLGVEKILNIPLDVLEVNERGTANALKAAARNDVERFVFSSSSEIYGEPRKVPVTEDTPPSPVSIYGVSKLAAEAYCNAYARTTGLEVTCLRFFNVYGPGQAEEFVISRFISRVARGQPPIIYGTGEQVRAYTYISDAIDGVLLATSHRNGANETFNVGSKECVTVAELARLVIEISGTHLTPIQRVFGDGIRSAQREIYTRIPDTSKAEKSLGFQSRTSLCEGLTRCYEWYSSYD